MSKYFESNKNIVMASILGSVNETLSDKEVYEILHSELNGDMVWGHKVEGN